MIEINNDGTIEFNVDVTKPKNKHTFDLLYTIFLRNLSHLCSSFVIYLISEVGQ